MKDVKLEASRRKVDLVILPTDRAVDYLTRTRDKTNAVLHVYLLRRIRSGIVRWPARE